MDCDRCGKPIRPRVERVDHLHERDEAGELSPDCTVGCVNRGATGGAHRTVHGVICTVCLTMLLGADPDLAYTRVPVTETAPAPDDPGPLPV